MAQGMKRDQALQISGVTKHQYYNNVKGGKRGRKCSTYTLKHEEAEIVKEPNDKVVEQIKEAQSDPDQVQGYHGIRVYLLLLGYVINHKKVYRLMKENQLLQAKPKPKSKQFVKYRIVIPDGPLEVIEMDIKFVWVEQYRRHAYVLTVLDCFTRVVLAWQVAYRITQHQVKQLWEQVIVEHLQGADMLKRGIHIEIRNDNDSRFAAHLVQEFFKENHLNQCFTHPYTPQENGHIESFHAIISRTLSRQEFWSLEQLETGLTIFYEKYNNRRLHGSLAHLPPLIFWEQWEKGNIQRIVMDKKKVKFKLKIPYHELSGKVNLREHPALTAGQQKIGPEKIQPSVQRFPSVASC